MKKIKIPDSYVLDTSALLIFWNDEEGADTVERILRSDTHVSVSFMSFMEGRYRIWKNTGEKESAEFSHYLVSVYKQRIMLSVIPRLDRGIRCFQGLLDYPIKPDNDKIRLYTQTLTN